MSDQEAGDLEVKVVRLKPMRVAASHGFGPSPEEIAWKEILGFAAARGLLDEPHRPRFFGFNNPNPSAGSPSYGYEQWMTVEPGVVGDVNIEIKEVPGSTYLVTRCTLQNITDAWMRLVMWQEGSSYEMAPGYCLEECITPPPPETPRQVVMDLYLPVLERK
jgi:DNA gyrase inhibitor GyrI